MSFVIIGFCIGDKNTFWHVFLTNWCLFVIHQKSQSGVLVSHFFTNHKTCFWWLSNFAKWLSHLLMVDCLSPKRHTLALAGKRDLP
jgi:hypothetical protein